MGISVSLLIFRCAYYRAFSYQISQYFFLPLRFFGFDLNLALLVEYKRARGGHGGPTLICRGKNRIERQKGRISVKKLLKTDIKVEIFLF